MKKILIGLVSVVGAVLVFAGGVYASEQGWLSFTGDEHIEQSGDHIDEIMTILREVDEGKRSAESALAEVQGKYDELLELNPKGLVDKIKHLESDLANKQTELDNKIAEVEAKQEEINEKNKAYDKLQQERDALATQRDELQAQIDSNNEYVRHLEEELTRANEAVSTHGEKTQNAVEEAREIKGE